LITHQSRLGREFENLLAAQGAVPQQGVGEQTNAVPRPR